MSLVDSLVEVRLGDDRLQCFISESESATLRRRAGAACFSHGILSAGRRSASPTLHGHPPVARPHTSTVDAYFIESIFL